MGKKETSREAARMALRDRRMEVPPERLDPPPPLSEDTLWRGMTRDGELRILVARTSLAVESMAQLQKASAGAGQVIGELATAALLIRSTVDPDGQLQLTIEQDGGVGRAMADVWPGEGGLRVGLGHPERDGTTPQLLCGGTMHVVRSRRRKTPYRSSSPFQNDGVVANAMRYLVESEQILALLELDVRVTKTEVRAAGFLVQVTPEGERSDLERLVQNCSGLPGLCDGMTAADPDGRQWADRVLEGYVWDQAARERVGFECRCSLERLVAVLRSLSSDEIDELSREGAPLESRCEFCRAVYTIRPEELREGREI